MIGQKCNCSGKMTGRFAAINFSFTGNFYLIKTDSEKSEFLVQFIITTNESQNRKVSRSLKSDLILLARAADKTGKEIGRAHV